MDPTLLDNVVKCLHLPKRGKGGGGGAIMSDYGDTTTVACYAVKHVPLPRQGYYNQTDGLWGEKEMRHQRSQGTSVPDHAKQANQK
jgi:hypothetical protein